MSKHKQGKDEEVNVFVDVPSTLDVACVIILLHQRIELRISKEIVFSHNLGNSKSLPIKNDTTCR